MIDVAIKSSKKLLEMDQLCLDLCDPVKCGKDFLQSHFNEFALCLVNLKHLLLDQHAVVVNLDGKHAVIQ